MRRVREFKPGDDLRVRQAIQLLTEARSLLTRAKCPKAVSRVSLALSSAKGAARNINYRKLHHDHPEL